MDFDLTPPPAQEATVSSPIADLSYRNYDGELRTRSMRWWVISLAILRSKKKNVGFWITVGLVVMVYFIAGVGLYLSSGVGNAVNQVTGGTNKQQFANQFLQITSGLSLFVFIIAMIAGAGAISADNKANALMVYLSKPLTKTDYVIGKWVGIFLTIFLTTFLPALVFYLYCMSSYINKGFFKNEPWLFVQVVGACLAPAVVHASVIMGCSAWSKTPAMAGIFYAGLFFVSQVISGVLWGIIYRGKLDQGVLLRHMSIDGGIKGLQEILFNVKTPIFGMIIPAPPAAPILALTGTLCIAGIAAARYKIRAVEVVKG